MSRPAAIVVIVVVALRSVASADDTFFQSKIAPIFESRCVRCHQGEKPKGGLALTTAKRAMSGGESGAILEPDKPDDSLLLEYISGDPPEMPKDGPPLSAEQIELIRKWIADGARWPDGVELADKKVIDRRWWSLEPLARPDVPKINSSWVRTPIDAFVLARLQKEGLLPTSEADRRTLIRRLTFDLHGLPPTIEEVDAFVADRSADAYERLVDRLFASPRYGERWARHWLDVVHYGETHGYDKDKPRPNAWPYRDYVISAFNSDKPYPRFIEEQLAGDVLFPDDPQATVATGFIAAGPWDFVGHVELREGTVDKDIARSNDRDDMVATTMSTFTSLTVHCARCHNHKFDPIRQQDYYRLQAVFAGIDRSDRPYDADSQTARERRDLLAKKAAAGGEQTRISAEIAKLTSPQLDELQSKIARLAEQLKTTPAPGVTVSPTNGYHSAIMPTADALKWVQVDLGKMASIDQVRLIPARPTDFPDTPGFGFPVRFRVDASADADFHTPTTITDFTKSDYENPGDQPLVLKAGDQLVRYIRVTATRLWPRTNDYVFALAELQAEHQGKLLPVAKVTAADSIEAGRWSTKYLTDGFDSRKSLSDQPSEGSEFVQLDGELRHLRSEFDSRRAELIPTELRKQADVAQQTLDDIARRLAALPPHKLVYAAANGLIAGVSSSAPKQPRPVYLLARGDVRSPRDLMQPGAVECVPGPDSVFKLPDSNNEGERRAALAHWLSDRSNVLVRRSIVNRVWHYHFGQGLVDTPNDFGRMGSLPSHPELLEWLAGWFLENGESLKRLHRLIVTSSVYRQASTENEAAAKLDSGNRLLWRMNRQRLDAESIRDAMLAVTGKLDLTMGGPSVQQFFFKDDHSPVYDYGRFDVDDPRSFRRSIYRFIVRSVPDPLMDCLDAADPSILTAKRNTTLTAIQALAMLNNRFAVRQSEHLAERVVKKTAEPAAQVELAFRLALQRLPTREEVQAFVPYVEKHGLANACRIFFNSNEFMFVD